jgi:signal transduction histidine kinase
MARRKLTLEEQLKGVRAAVRSKRTPPQLRDGLRKRAKWLIEEIRQGRPRKRKKRPLSSRRMRTNQ